LFLCSEISDHFGWEVFDEQLGDFLDKDTLRNASPSRDSLEDDREETGRLAAANKASFAGQFMEELLNHGAVPLISTLVIAAFVAGCLLIHLNLVEDRFPWLFFVAFSVLHTVRAFLWAARQRAFPRKK